MMKGVLDILIRLEVKDIYLRQEEYEMILSYILIVLRGKFFGNMFRVVVEFVIKECNDFQQLNKFICVRVDFIFFCFLLNFFISLRIFDVFEVF